MHPLTKIHLLNIYGTKFTKYLNGTWEHPNDFWHDR